MLQTRVIPCLQLINRSLVKTVRFKNPAYIGDPVNTVRIFNELEVDELCFLDIRATLEQRSPDMVLLKEIADECFMPLSYGGGIRDLVTVQRILAIGFEKVILNTAALLDTALLRSIADKFGSQSLVGAIDIRRNLFGKAQVTVRSGTQTMGNDPVDCAVQLVEAGVGELLVSCIDREGTWKGFDTYLVKRIADAVNVPVIAHGGAGSSDHVREVLSVGGAHAVALGNLLVYQKKGMGVLVNFPQIEQLQNQK
jgi:cyclase